MMWDWFAYYFSQLADWGRIKSILLWMVIALETAMGWWGSTVQALWLLMVMDFVLGFSEAWIEKRISFPKLRQWVWKFTLYSLAILLGHQIDVLILHSSMEFWFKNAFVVYLWVNESLSIIRHFHKFWLPVPKSVVNKLEEIKKSLD